MAFKVGDKVDSIWGEGIVCKSDSKSTMIKCFKHDGFCDSYSVDEQGKTSKRNSYPSVWHIETGSPPQLGDEPDRFEYPLVMKSTDSKLVVEFTSLTEGTVVHSSCCWHVGYVSSKWSKHTDSSEWEPCERPDPYQKFKDHLANGGEIEYLYCFGMWEQVDEPIFGLKPENYRCVPIPTGKDLIGKLCWVGDEDDRQEAKDNGDLRIIVDYDDELSYGYNPEDPFAFAWPVRKNELDGLFAT